MAVKGAAAKEQVIKRISSAFGEDFIGEVDKKIYVWANDNGEKVQIAISLTCPKNFVENISSVKSLAKLRNPTKTASFEPKE